MSLVTVAARDEVLYLLSIFVTRHEGGVGGRGRSGGLHCTDIITLR